MAANYFDRYDEQAGNYFDKYDAAPVPVAPPKPTKRTWGEATQDIAASVVGGAGSLVQLPGQLYGLATGDFSDTGALGLGKDISKYGEEMKSATLKEKEAARAKKIQEAEKSGQVGAAATAFWETLKDPALLTSFIAEQAPQLLIPFGAAKVAQIGTAAKVAAAAEGLTGKAAEKAVEAATKAAATRGTRAAIGAGAVQQGADVGAQAYEDIYKELKRQGASDTDAAQAAINLARGAGASAALLSLLAQRLPGAKTLEESFAGVKGTSGRLVGALQGALGEGASEVVEETGGKFGANLAMREIKPEQSLLEGLGQTAGMAAVGGVGMGGVAGALRKPGDYIEVINGKKFINGKPVEEEPAKEETGLPIKPAPVLESEKGEGVSGETVPPVSAIAEEPAATRPTIQELRARADREAQLQAERQGAGFDFEQRMAQEQIAAGREMRKPATEERPEYIDLRPLQTPLAQRQALVIAKDEARQQGIDPERIKLAPHPKVPDAMTLIRTPAPEVVAPVEPTVKPEEVQARLEQIGLAAKEAERRKEDEARQVVLTRALQNIEERGGIASPEEARVVDEANIGTPYDRVDENLGRTLSTDERLTEATGILLSKAPRESITFATEAERKRVAMEKAAEEQARAGTVPPSQVVQETPVSTGIEEGRAIRPEGGIEPSVTEDRQRVEPVAPPTAKPAEPAPTTAPAPAPRAASRGRETRIITPDGNKIPAQWEVIEADSVSAAMVEGKTQPRDRTRSVSKAQILAIAQNPDFDRLSDTSQTMDYGAPTLTEDYAIVGGNGRFEGINIAYDSEAGQGYRQSLMNNAERLGLDPDAIAGMKKPVLVRRITQPADTRKLAIQSNIVAGIELSDVEQAALDAERMEGLDRLSISEYGDIPLTSSNAAVIRDALKSYTTEEVGKMMSEDGGLSAAGLRRIKNAILYKAYGKTDVLSRLVESPDPDLKNVGTALMRASGMMSQLRDAIKAGEVSEEYDIANDLTGAIETLSSLRASGASVLEFLNQADIFDDGISGSARAILRFMDKNLRSARAIADYMNDYAKVVLSSKEAEGGIFETLPPPSKQETLENATKRYEVARGEGQKQPGIFEQPAGEISTEGREKPEGKGRAAGSDEEAEIKKSLRADAAQQVAAFEQTLRTTLNKFGLKDVGLNLVDGLKEAGSYAQQLIKIAADSANPIRTLRHEAIHALRELGFFTDAQWKSLSKMAKDKWIDQYLKQRNIDGKPLKAGEESRYDAYMREYNGDMEKITEEAVADAFADFDSTKPPSGLMQALLTRMRNLFQALKSALTKVESPEQIFGKVERGELKAGAPAKQGEAKSLRAEKPKAEPTEAGQAALNTINEMGMGVQPPPKSPLQEAKEMLKKAKENPDLTKKEALKSFSRFMDKLEGAVFSADAPFENALRRGLKQDMASQEATLGLLIEASQSQAVGADPVATQAVLRGRGEYDPEVLKWVAVDDENNMTNLAGLLDQIAEKYGLARDEAQRIAHTYFVAKNYRGILKHNAELQTKIEAVEAEAQGYRKQGKIREADAAQADADALKDALVYVSDKQAEMVEPGLGLIKQIPELGNLVEMWEQIRQNFVWTLISSGLWSPEYATAMINNIDYVPFFREEQIAEEEGPQQMIRGLQVKAKEHKLKGSENAVNDVFDNMTRWMQYAMNRAIRNHKALQMVDIAAEMPVGDRMMATRVTEPKRGMNVARVWREGKQEFYDMADPLYLGAFQSLGALSIPSIKYFTAISNILRKTVVMYPLFSMGQLTQDSVAAIFASGLKPKFAFKIPYLAVKEFFKTMKGWSTTHDELVRYGVVGVRDFNATVARQDAQITAGIKAPRGVWGKVNYVLDRIAMSADNAVRQAMYIAATDAGLSKKEALEKAFEIINFRRRGSSKLVNLLGQTVPFFYAYLSAQRVAYRTLTGVGISPTTRKAALETLAQTSAGVMALSFLYAMANGDDEEYKKTPATIRDRSIIIPGSEGLRIPLRPDFFLFPKVIAEHTYQLITDEGYSDGAKFRKSLADLFVSSVSSPNAVPQIVKPSLETAINYSFFEGRPIVGFFEQNKEAGRQFNESTSEFAKLLGQMGISPAKADHWIRGYFGSVGGLFLWGTNFFIEGQPGVPRAELTAHDIVSTMPGVGAFRQKPTENALKIDFYELRDAIAKAKNTYDDIKTRSPEGLQDFLEDKKNVARLAMDKRISKIADHLSQIRRVIQQVAAAPEERMTASQKQERIKQLREIEMSILKAVNVKGLREQAML